MSFTLNIQSATSPTSADIVKRVSTAADGTQADAGCFQASFSADGRYAVFESAATNLVAGAGGSHSDIFRKDLVTGAIEVVSKASDNQTLANMGSNAAAISADGRYVVFASSATNLVAGNLPAGITRIYRKDMTTGAIELATLASGGAPANDDCYNARISADGNFVLFDSAATNLVGGDANGVHDIFRKNLTTGEIVLVAVAGDAAQTQSNGPTRDGRMSSDGRYVVFESDADNLVAGDVNGATDIFRKDLLTGDIVLVSTDKDGNRTAAGQDSDTPQISADGRYVVFSSDADNLVAGDTNGQTDIFRKDLSNGAIMLVSTAGDTARTQGNGGSDSAQVSRDGRYVIFESHATNLVAGDTNASPDLFRKDLLTGEILRLSSPFEAQGHEQANSFSSWGNLSGDGRYLVLQSYASNLVEGDTNGALDIFRKDLTTGAIERVSSGAAHLQANGPSASGSISENGRYVVFDSTATNLVSADGNNTTDIFRKDLATGGIELISSEGGVQGDKRSYLPKVSADGNFVLFESQATNLVSGDTQGFVDIFQKDIAGNSMRLVSSASDGTTPANGDSFQAEMSADGRYVVFASLANNIVATDSNAKIDVFRKDMSNGAVVLISTASNNVTQGNLNSQRPHLSADGNYVVFESESNNLVAGDSNSSKDIFRKNVTTGATALVSASAGGIAGDQPSYNARISADGQYVLFESGASNLVADDTNGASDIFRKDLTNGAIIQITNARNASDISGHARFGANADTVIFHSNASYLVPRDTNRSTDVFSKNLLTGEVVRLSETNRALQGNEEANDRLENASISLDGRFIIVDSYASNLVAGDTNDEADIFVTDASLLPHTQAIAEGRFLRVALGVGTASSVSVAWGDGGTDTVNPAGGNASFGHAYSSTGVKAATVSVEDGSLTWTVPYRVDVASAKMTRDAALLDTISGSSANDTLVGDAGANVLIGNAGDDSYVVNDVRDLVTEAVGGGLDTVTTSVSYALGFASEVEVVLASGTASVALTGNAFANTLVGSAGANSLGGGGGNDLLKGLTGKDVLRGDAGHDTLAGSTGKDVLSGGAGRDIFVFDTKANTKTNVDRIVDFNVRDDTIWLDNKYFKVGKGTPAKPQKLAKAMFWTGDKAHDADDRFFYDRKKNALFYDADGSGKGVAILLAIFNKNVKPTYGDFGVI